MDTAREYAKTPATSVAIISAAFYLIATAAQWYWTDAVLAVLIGVVSYHLVFQAAFHMAIYLRFTDWLIATGQLTLDKEEPKTAPPPAEQPAQQPRRHEATAPRDTVQVVQDAGFKAEHLAAFMRAYDAGQLVEPLSENKLQAIDISRGHPRPVSYAKALLIYLEGRGVIDSDGYFQGTIPPLSSLPYPIELD
jgi:hypothetical protein